jgi:hypothetical protein
LLLTAVTSQRRSRIVWFAERNHAYFLLHPDHLPIFLPPPSRRRARTICPWLKALVAWLRAFSSSRDSSPRVGILDELLSEKEFLELQLYLQGRNWDLQVLKTWSRIDFTTEQVELASWNLAGFLLELSGGLDYGLSFRAVGCVEALEYEKLPAYCAGRQLIDHLIAD